MGPTHPTLATPRPDPTPDPWFAVETALGWLGVAYGPGGLRRLALPHAEPATLAEELGAPETPVPPAHADLAQRLQGYAAGRPQPWPDPLDPAGATPFRRAVWEAAMSIPWGEVRSYGWLAAALGCPGAARAVGTALGANPLPIIVPCHRVVGAQGTLVGYAGGLEMKRRLLALEGIEPSPIRGQASATRGV